MAREPVGPTRDGAREGREPSSGIPWAFESPEAHWSGHDARQVRYWRSRPPAERLARAAHYRVLRHGTLLEPAVGDTVVRFIALDDLIENKRAAARPKDLADVAALESAGRD